MKKNSRYRCAILNIDLFVCSLIHLPWVLVAACGILVASRGISHCSAWTLQLPCSGLVAPQLVESGPDIAPVSQAPAGSFLTPGLPGSPPSVLLKQRNSQNSDCHHIRKSSGRAVGSQLVTSNHQPGSPGCTRRKEELVMGRRFPRGFAGQRWCCPCQGTV